MKGIKEIGHAYKIDGVYVVIDANDTGFKSGTAIQQVHYRSSDCMPYIWFNRTTYQLKEDERRK